MLKYRIEQLRKAKEKKTKQAITYEAIAKATGVSVAVLKALLKSEEREVATNTRHIEALCRYFGCEVGELVRLGKLGDAPRGATHVEALYPKRKTAAGGKVAAGGRAAPSERAGTAGAPEATRRGDADPA